MDESRHPIWEGASIVALGAFNPKIFHPQWFARNELIRGTEAEQAEVHVVSADFAFVEFGRFVLKATQHRFSVETVDPRMQHGPLKDLVSGTFTVLEHTPINAFGFNSKKTFRLPRGMSWREFSGHFAPEGNWTGLLLEPSVNMLTVRGTRQNCHADRIQISVHPDGGQDGGVAISLNEHYEVSADRDNLPSDPADMFVMQLRDTWDDFLSYSRVAADQLLDIDSSGPNS